MFKKKSNLWLKFDFFPNYNYTMYSSIVPYYYSYSSYHSTNNYNMDMICAHNIQLRLKEDYDKDYYTKKSHTTTTKIKELYNSPKRNSVCCKCGQQYHWCNCDLKDTKD